MNMKFLDEYSGQSTQELIDMAQEYRVDSLVLALEQGLEAKTTPPPLNVTERTVLAVEALEREVNNGGYEQFFLNSSNEYALEIVAALTRIGCPVTSGLTQRAIDALQISGSVTLEAIEEVIEEEDASREETLQGLDDEYFEAGEAIADRLFAFVSANISEVRLP